MEDRYFRCCQAALVPVKISFNLCDESVWGGLDASSFLFLRVKEYKRFYYTFKIGFIAAGPFCQSDLVFTVEKRADFSCLWPIFLQDKKAFCTAVPR